MQAMGYASLRPNHNLSINARSFTSSDALVGDDDVASAGDLHDLVQILDELQKLAITAESVVFRDDLVE
jgi:hypothetical protein